MTRCLVLCCGNPIRGDDRVALEIAEALELSASMPQLEVIADQQWMPELAERISEAEAVFFVDASTSSPAGSISCFPVEPAPSLPRLFTHHMDAPALLRLTLEVYGKLPRKAILLTIGALSMELSEELSAPVRQALPEAVATLTGGIREIFEHTDLTASK